MVTIDLPFTIRTSLILSLLSLQFMLREVLPVQGDVGTALSYGPPYTPTQCHGNRQDQFPTSNMFVSVSSGLWNNGAACGRKYSLRCLSGNNRPCRPGTIDVVVVDKCPGACGANLLLSADAFAAISSISNAKIFVEYTES